MVPLLFALNLTLQCFDGLATYDGLTRGVQKGNPLLHACMEFYGVGATLVGAKSAACLFLCYLRETASLTVSQWGLVLAALSYMLFSFVPWVLVLLTV